MVGLVKYFVNMILIYNFEKDLKFWIESLIDINIEPGVINFHALNTAL